MMKKFCTIILVLFALQSIAQTQKVIGAAGNYTDAGAYTVAWTIGEPIITTVNGTSNVLTQGFHQGDIYVLSVEKYSELAISVYPNPADDIINILSDYPSKMSIYNAQGKLIQLIDLFETTASVDVSDLSRGTYLLVFEAEGSISKKMKIVIL